MVNPYLVKLTFLLVEHNKYQVPNEKLFFGIVSLVFSNFSMVLETHVKLCVTEPDFSEKKLFAQKIGKIDQKCAKNRVFLIY